MSTLERTTFGGRSIGTSLRKKDTQEAHLLNVVSSSDPQELETKIKTLREKVEEEIRKDPSALLIGLGIRYMTPEGSAGAIWGEEQENAPIRQSSASTKSDQINMSLETDNPIFQAIIPQKSLNAMQEHLSKN
ncbi:MAG: hypothetical protein JSR80_03395 [Verrucomicrobia bacterium]|nr:hypothetical protein [Verrucomicrobiota bacterium]